MKGEPRWAVPCPSAMTCREVGSSAACRGDLNCDAVVGFLDINAFVLYLSNLPVWQTIYGGCLAANGDIDGNGVYPAFAGINPFVTLLTTHSLPLPCGDR